MGSGSFTKCSFETYAKRRGFVTKADGALDLDHYGAQEVFSRESLDKSMSIKGKVRECRDSEEHPETVPVIIGIDVTGSMGPAAKEVASQMGNIMTTLFDKVKDVEFMVMGIGDLAYDYYPVQVSQFESDIRISEHLDKICFEAGGGGNDFESYTAAWFVGARCTDLDCWKRGKRGLIITIGDEKLNPYLPLDKIVDVTGKPVSDEKTLNTSLLADEVQRKYALAHIHIAHSTASTIRTKAVKETCEKVGVQCVVLKGLDNLATTITDIVVSHANGVGSIGPVESFLAEDTPSEPVATNKEEGISW